MSCARFLAMMRISMSRSSREPVGVMAWLRLRATIIFDDMSMLLQNRMVSRPAFTVHMGCPCFVQNDREINLSNGSTFCKYRRPNRAAWGGPFRSVKSIRPEMRKPALASEEAANAEAGKCGCGGGANEIRKQRHRL